MCFPFDRNIPPPAPTLLALGVGRDASGGVTVVVAPEAAEVLFASRDCLSFLNDGDFDVDGAGAGDDDAAEFPSVKVRVEIGLMRSSAAEGAELPALLVAARLVSAIGAEVDAAEDDDVSTILIGTRLRLGGAAGVVEEDDAGCDDGLERGGPLTSRGVRF